MSVASSPRKKSKVKHESVEADSSSHEAEFHTPEATLGHRIVMSLVVALPFIACVYGIYSTWQYGYMGNLYLGMLLGGWTITGLGITIGYHRLATHRSFETFGWIRALFILAGAMAVEGSPTMWVAVHRRHHALSDQPDDPHTPHGHGKGVWNMLKGFVFAHFGWLLTGFWSSPDLIRYAPDLNSERWLRVINQFYPLCVVATLAIPMAIGGLVTGTWQGAWLGLFWGGLVRVFMTHHITWSINSICHIFGSKDYDAHDDSRNNVLFGFLAFGEGWHNNHHAFPTSARHGLKWWQFDTSWLIIRTLSLLGLAWNVKLPTEKQMEARINKAA